MSSNPLPPEVKAPPGGIRTRGGRRPLSRRRWRQRDYMARFGQYATSRGYDVAVRMEDGDMRAVVIRFPDVDHNNVWKVARQFGAEYADVRIAQLRSSLDIIPTDEYWRLIVVRAKEIALSW